MTETTDNGFCSYICTEISHGQLPEFFERGVCCADSPQQCDMLLLGMLAATSAALPNLKMLHGFPQHEYHPNLMALIIAPPASGKGVLNNVRQLLEPLARLLEPNEHLFIPANSSSAAFMQLLAENEGSAFMMETEMDVLSQTWRSDYANYSYMMRQAFEHETISKARLNSGMQVIEHPKLSVLLSGTLGQLTPLLGSQENGLSSRFLTYLSEDIQAFDGRSFLHGDHVSENSAKQVFRELGEELLQRYYWLYGQKQPVIWSLTEAQAEQMSDFFSDGWMLSMTDMQMPISFDPVIKRMAVSIKRIGLILSAMRLDMTQPLPEVIYCSEQDFQTLLLLAEKLLTHAGTALLRLPQSERTCAHITTSGPTADDLLALLPDHFTTAEAVEKGKGINISERSTYRRLEQLEQEQAIERISKGFFRRSATK